MEDFHGRSNEMPLRGRRVAALRQERNRKENKQEIGWRRGKYDIIYIRSMCGRIERHWFHLRSRRLILIDQVPSYLTTAQKSAEPLAEVVHFCICHDEMMLLLYLATKRNIRNSVKVLKTIQLNMLFVR